MSEEFIKTCIEKWNPQNNVDNPWEENTMFHKEDVDGKLHIVLDSAIYIQKDNLKPRIQNRIRRLARISNPAYFKNLNMGLSNYSQHRYIYLGNDSKKYIEIPRGLLDTLLTESIQAGIKYTLQDKRIIGKELHIEFNGTLRFKQEEAVSKLWKYDNGILNAATAFGKTVVCRNIISKIKTSTLILIESSTLMEQWIEALERFLIIDEDLPEYTTKTGLIRKERV